MSNNILVLIFIAVFCIKYSCTWSFNPLCLITECCNSDYIPGDTDALKLILKKRVYGQHLVELAVDAIAGHWSHAKPPKALAMSFHGWPGGGKNYVSKFIAESLFKLGTRSKYVHHFIGRIHFPLEESAETYKENLYQWLKGNISRCPQQLFIFDEVDKMPPQVLNAITPMLDYRDIVDGVDYTKAIFLFLSNTGAALINEQYHEYWETGRKREDLKLSDFENLVSKGAFNEAGGFYRADPIKSNLIDHYIPYLPMQEEHVIACIRDQFRERNVQFPHNAHIKEVMDFIEWGPDTTKLFSKTGCKRISSKVAIIVAKYYPLAGKEGKSEL